MEKRIKITKSTIKISLILLLSAVLNFANLGIEGYANTFYAAGVKSMLISLKNFFFVSFDPSGFVTIDKPPLGFWIQALSAKIFGFKGWSIILPQALAGVISVGLIYYIVKKSFGESAGLIAALCLAVTPISVASGRNNTIDNLLVLFLILAGLTALKASKTGKARYIILSLAIVGIGFNIKMVEAYMVLPAVYMTYLLSSSIPLKKRIKHLAAGTVVLLAVSLSWAVVVDMMPKDQRPFIGSSTDNSVMELIIGHNGLERIGLSSKLKNIGKSTNKNAGKDVDKNAEKNNRNMSTNKNKNVKMPIPNGGNMRNNSKTGITRLFLNNNLSDQISWFLPLALIGFAVAAFKEKLKFPIDNDRKLSLVFWFMWFLPEFIYFSFIRNITHSYYLTTMAPPIAALTGIGISVMYEFYKDHGLKSWILPFALIVNGCAEILILSYNYNKYGYKAVIAATALLCIVSSVGLCIINLSKNKTNLSTAFACAAFAGILAAPTVWSFTPTFFKMNGSSPSAGLEIASSVQIKNFERYGFSNNNSNSESDSKLIGFLEDNKTSNEKYLVMTPSAMTYASNLIIETGKPVMALGGFSGSDRIITLDEFKKLVNDGTIKYAIVNGSTKGNMGFGKESSNNQIMDWIRKNGKVVPYKDWMSSNDLKKQSEAKKQNFTMGNSRNMVKLYDLKPNM